MTMSIKLYHSIASIIERDGLDTSTLLRDGEFPVFDKFDEYIPAELLIETPVSEFNELKNIENIFNGEVA